MQQETDKKVLYTAKTINTFIKNHIADIKSLYANFKLAKIKSVSNQYQQAATKNTSQSPVSVHAGGVVDTYVFSIQFFIFILFVLTCFFIKESPGAFKLSVFKKLVQTYNLTNVTSYYGLYTDQSPLTPPVLDDIIQKFVMNPVF